MRSGLAVLGYSLCFLEILQFGANKWWGECIRVRAEVWDTFGRQDAIYVVGSFAVSATCGVTPLRRTPSRELSAEFGLKPLRRSIRDSRELSSTIDKPWEKLGRDSSKNTGPTVVG